MKQKLPSELSDIELLEERKKTKSGSKIQAALIGLLIGVAIYSTVKKGFGFFTLFPLFFILILSKKNQRTKEIETEIKSRNLE